MNYKDLNLKMYNKSVSLSITPNNTINVFQYISIEDKNSIIQLALQNAFENGSYNLLKLDMFYKLYIIYTYTDLEFTMEEKLDPVSIYDNLESNGIMNAVIQNMNPEELGVLDRMMKETYEQKVQYNGTLASVINNFIHELPMNAQAAKDIIEKFNPEDFKAVIDFATAANGNRPIN